MKRLAILPTLFAWSCLLAEGPPGAPASPSADLASLLREAEASHPAIRAAAARREAARHLPAQAGTRPDPMLSLGYVNDGVSQFTLGDSEFSSLALTWTQDLPYPGKLEASAEVARSEETRAGRETDRTRLEIRAGVKSGYAELYRLDRTRSLLFETRDALESLAQAALRRYEVGEGIQESVLKAQTETTKIEVELARVEQDRLAAEARLNSAVGRATPEPIGPVTALPEGRLPADTAAIADEAAGASPEVAALEAAAHRSAAAVERARLDLKPDFSWSASYQYRGGLDPMLAGMFGVKLPVSRKRRQAEAVSQAEAEHLAAGQDLAALRLRTRAEVLSLVARAERAGRLVTLFGNGVIPQASGALESAQTSYRVGRLAFLDLMNDQLAVLQARVALVDQETERIQALAALEPLLERELVTAEPAADAREEGR